MRNCFLFAVLCCLLLNCGKEDDSKGRAKILVSIQAAYHKKIYLQQQAFNDEQAVNIDSAVIQSGLDSFVFYIPAGEQRLYAITVAETGVRIPFIVDTNSIEVYYNYATRRYGFKNSIASAELKEFTERQLNAAKNGRTLKFFIDSVKKGRVLFPSLKDSVAKFDSLSIAYFGAYKNFADTVPSPAAFFAVYDAVDFGNDRAGLKAFINRALQRFPQHNGVKVLAKNVLEYIKVLDEPYNVGDTLPALVLPDEFGIDFSTASLSGKYMIVNVWSSLCDECEKYAAAIAKAKQLLPPARFEAVSIALDEKQQWLDVVKKRHYNWPQLIDEKMWNGTAFKTLRFSSMPYNFIVAPGGRIVAKAVPADSIVVVLQQVVH